MLILACGEAESSPTAFEPETPLESSELVRSDEANEENAAETSVPFEPSTDLPPLPSLNGAFFGPELPLREAQTRYVQMRNCRPHLGSNFSLLGFSFVVPDDFSRVECNEEGPVQYVVFSKSNGESILDSRIAVSGVTGAVAPNILEQEAVALLRSALGPEAQAAKLADSQADSVEVHGSSLPSRELAFIFPDAHEGIYKGRYLAQLVPVARPFMRNPAGQVLMSPNQPGLLVIGIERVVDGDTEAARERLRSGPARLAVHSLRFRLPEGFSRPEEEQLADEEQP